MELTGFIYKKIAPQTVGKNNNTKASIILRIENSINGETYVNYAQLDFWNKKADLLANFEPEQLVTVAFNVKGAISLRQDGTEGVINNLDAWRIELKGIGRVPAQKHQPAPQTQPVTFDLDKSPF
jgi:Domain of unknown function (DUF3127)